MTKRNKRLILLITILLVLISTPLTGTASIQEITLKNGLVATADFRQGKPGKPALVVLHGFLSTRNFLTVSSLIESLAGDEFTVLAPNLSLGVNRRNKSLACEAIHTHDIDADIAEIDQWVTWLQGFGYKDIVLVGHSYGSLHGLLYLEKHPEKHIKKLVAASLVDVEHVVGKEKSQAQIQTALAQIKMHDKGLHEYQVSYCKKFISPANTFLSYASWSQEKILSTIAQVHSPLEIILGGKDKRMGENWPDLLRKNGVKLSVIEGANHFFNNEQEIDLLESVLKALQDL